MGSKHTIDGEFKHNAEAAENLPIELKSYVDDRFSVVLNDLANARYVENAVIGVEHAYEKEFKDQEEALADFIQISNGIDYAADNYNVFYNQNKPKIDQMQLNEEKFLFPSGDEAEKRRVQFQALKFAEISIGSKRTVDENIAVLDSQKKKLNYEDSEKLRSKVVAYSPIKKEKADTALAKIGTITQEKRDIFSKNLSNVGTANTEDYALSNQLCQYLQSEGENAVVVNCTLEDVLQKQKEVEKSKVENDCDNIRNATNAKIIDRKSKKPPKKFIWISSACLFALIFYLAMGFGNISLLYYAIAIPVYVVCFFLSYMILNIKIKAFNKKNEVRREHLLSYVNEIKKPEALAKFVKQYDILKMCKIADEKVFSRYYQGECKLYVKYEETRNKMIEFLKRLNQVFEEINYLPSGLDYAKLPQIIELMESGAASDYQSAMKQVVQNTITKTFNDAQLAIMEVAEEQRKNEARAQREMQERYERQRLNEAREAAARQAESARRAEEYAKAQAEAAKRTAESQAESAKYAQKQAEAAEELLRRADDPYYIKRWKNGG